MTARVLLAAGLLAACCSQVFGNTDFVNEDVKTRLDVSKHVVKVTHAVTVAGSDARASKYVLALPAEQGKHVAHVAAKEIGGAGTLLKVVQSESHSTHNTTAYIINLGKAVGSDSTMSVKIQLSLTHVLTPLPAIVEQAEQQYVVYDGLVHMLSPYTTKASKTEVRLASSKVKDFTNDDAVQPAKVDGSKIVYGPYADLPPMAHQPLHVHFASNAAFATFTNVEREIEVSLWGNIAVEEYYTLQHTGATLREGLFSRIDYMKGAVGNSFRALHGTLPAGVRDVYYRDIIGNISTSNMRHELDSTVLDIEARFPLFGGWQTEWYLGYNLPTQGALTSAGGAFTLTMPLAITFPDSVTDEYVVKVVLPEGASDVNVQPALDMPQVDSFTRFTYLDAVMGRPVLEIRGTNIIKAHKGDLVVTFNMPPNSMLREPAMLVGTFFTLFLLGSLVSRTRLSVDDA